MIGRSARHISRSALPSVPKGHTRLWRAEGPQMTPEQMRVARGMPLTESDLERRGTHFSYSREHAEEYLDWHVRHGRQAELKFVDVPEDVARMGGDDALAAFREAADPMRREVSLPQEWAQRAQPINTAGLDAERSAWIQTNGAGYTSPRVNLMRDHLAPPAPATPQPFVSPRSAPNPVVTDYTKNRYNGVTMDRDLIDWL